MAPRWPDGDLYGRAGRDDVVPPLAFYQCFVLPSREFTLFSSLNFKLTRKRRLDGGYMSGRFQVLEKLVI